MNAKDVTFAVCTGKQCERVEELFGAEWSKDIWILGDSATRIKYAGKYLYQSLIPNKLGQEIIERLEQITNDQVIIACTAEAAFIKDTVSATEVAKIRKSYTTVECVPCLQELKNDFVKLTVFDPKLRCLETVKQLADFQNELYIVASEAAWLDITNMGVHKGSTVAELQRRLNIQKAETMAFGDGLNDVELLAAADFSFAMRGAFAATKSAARYITGSNDENAVLQTIQQILSIQG